MSEVTRILSAIEHGDAHVADQLLPLVYDELKKLSAGLLRREGKARSLDTTALVHEAVTESGAGSPKDMGMVMKTVMPKVGGRADGKRVSAKVKEALS